MEKRIVLLMLLLFAGIVAFAQTDETNKEMVIAAEQGDSAKVARLLEEGAEVNTRTPDGITALMYAAQRGHADVVKLLLRQGADTDLQPWNGITALHSAVLNGYANIARILLNAGADTEKKDRWGLTPLHYATAFNYPVITEFLMQADASAFEPTPEGYTPMHLAAIAGNPLMGKILLHYGAPALNRDDKGFTPLHSAAQYGHKVFLKQLLDYGVNYRLLTSDGLSAVDIAAANSHASYVAYFADSLEIPKNKSRAWNALTLNRFRYNTDTLRRILRKNRQQLILKPWPVAVIFSYFTDWNFRDFMNGFAIGIYDKKWDFDLMGTFQWRPYDKAVFEKADNNALWQFRENRYLAGLWIDKYIALQKKPETHHNLFLRAGGAFTWGHYAGTTRRPKSQLSMRGAVGYSFKVRYFSAKAGYMYEDFYVANTSPHRIMLSLSARFPFRKLTLKSEPDWVK